jgi:hypothetical protein
VQHVTLFIQTNARERRYLHRHLTDLANRHAGDRDIGGDSGKMLASLCPANCPIVRQATATAENLNRASQGAAENFQTFNQLRVDGIKTATTLTGELFTGEVLAKLIAHFNSSPVTSFFSHAPRHSGVSRAPWYLPEV